ncbi:DNA polymerase-4 [Pleomorphomonas diazotrophica]|nr:DNA polymerase-4 [Pleomorphomonas diazotrophica]
MTLKLKTADFKLRTRTRRLADPTQLADRIFTAADALLAEEAHGQKYRLLGVSVADLCESRFADPADLVDQKATRKAAAERAMDEVRQKFGKRALETGLVFGNHRRHKE